MILSRGVLNPRKALGLHSLTSCLGTSKLGHENERHDLVSNHRTWHLWRDGSSRNATATGGRKAGAGFQPNDRRRLAGEPKGLSRQMSGSLLLSNRFHQRLYNGM